MDVDSAFLEKLLFAETFSKLKFVSSFFFTYSHCGRRGGGGYENHADISLWRNGGAVKILRNSSSQPV